MNRNGKHKDGDVRIGIYTEPEKKALAVLLTKLTQHKTITETVVAGLEMLARSRGVIDSDGKITQQFEAMFLGELEIVKQSKVKG